jgi:PmbA protein
MYENRIAGGLVGHLLGAIVGRAVARGTSFLKDSMGESLFRPEIAIIDDGTIRRGLASKPFDAEGPDTRLTPLVTRVASSAGCSTSIPPASLASSAAIPAAAPPARSPQPTNVTLAAGRRNPQALMRDLGRASWSPSSSA